VTFAVFFQSGEQK